MLQLIGLVGLFATVAAQAPGGLQPIDSGAVAAACGGEIPLAQIAAMPAAQRNVHLSCYTREAARQFSQQLPHQIDPATMLDRVSVDAAELTYHYTVNVLRTDVTAAMLETHKSGVRTRVCGETNMRNIIGVGGSYRYIWNDRNGERIGDMRIASC